MVEKNYFSDYTDEEEKTEEENKNFFSDYTVEDDIETEDAPKEENYFSDYVDENAVDSEEPKKEDTTSVFTPPKEKLTYEQFKQSPELVAAAMRFSKNRLGYDTISEEDAIDETIEHFRQFKVNELTAGKDWGYTSALAADNKRDEIKDYPNQTIMINKISILDGYEMDKGEIIEYVKTNWQDEKTIKPSRENVC